MTQHPLHSWTHRLCSHISILFFACLAVHSNLIWADGGSLTQAPTGGSITFDFSTNTWNFPTTSGTTALRTYTDGKHSITLSAPDSYYYSSWNTLLMGKTGAQLTLPAFEKAVTKIEVEGVTAASMYVSQNIYVGSKAVSTRTIGASKKNTYLIDENYQAAGNIYTLKVLNNYNTHIKYIIVYFAPDPIDVTLNRYGYATFCSSYPIDLTNADNNGFSAWQITEINGNNISFMQITGKIIGGTGMLLKGTPDTSISLKLTDSNNDISGTNKLCGITSATEINDGEYYGLKGTEFVPVNAGTVPAGKALLPADVVDGSGVKALTFNFETATGIISLSPSSATRMNNEQCIFNIAGQRLKKPQKGINIVNGKKVIMK